MGSSAISFTNRQKKSGFRFLFFLCFWQRTNRGDERRNNWFRFSPENLMCPWFQIPGNCSLFLPHYTLSTFWSPSPNLSWFLLLEVMQILIWETVEGKWGLDTVIIVRILLSFQKNQSFSPSSCSPFPPAQPASQDKVYSALLGSHSTSVMKIKQYLLSPYSRWENWLSEKLIGMILVI